MENNNIDKTFNEASKTLEEPATFPGFDKVWAKVEERLDKKEEKKRKTVSIWIPYGIAASLLIGSGIFYFNNKKENTEVTQPVITQNIAFPKKSKAIIPENIQKIDSTVKANIQNEVLPPIPVKLAYEPAVSKMYDASSVAPPVYTVVSPSKEDAIVPALENKIGDTLKRKDIEEVIAMGIKKEKASMVNSLASSTRKRISELNAIADTAEAAYPISAFDLKQSTQEPEILAYNKSGIKINKPIATTSKLGSRIGEKPDVNLLKGYTPGVSINSISGAPSSGRVDISISCQGSLKPDMNPLIVIDGNVSDMETFRKLDPKKIEHISVVKKVKTETLFSGKARNGLIVVQTKDISKKEKRKLKKLLKRELPEK